MELAALNKATDGWVGQVILIKVCEVNKGRDGLSAGVNNVK